MKPKEFDELVRQKFDRNDFAYDPKSWERLAERMDDGKAKKRSLLMWWWVPLAGMAASVALAVGVSSILRQANPGTRSGYMAHANNSGTAHPVAADLSFPSSSPSNTIIYTPGQVNANTTDQDLYNDAVASSTRSRKADRHGRLTGTRNGKRKTAGTADDDDQFGINLVNAIGNSKLAVHAPVKKNIDLTKDIAANTTKKQVAVVEPMNTFAPAPAEEVKKTSKISLILSGGYNHGNQNSGYMAGATIRRMLNDKVYIESDVAVARSSNTQSTAYVERAGTTIIGGSPAVSTRTMNGAARTADIIATPPTKTIVPDVIGQRDVSYDLYYAQVTPSIGYKVMRKMSIGVGPDFQQMLGDNRPAPSTVERNAVQVAPTFDIGFMGKTEYSLTKKVKAAVYYRKGVNNVITPTDKYIDRDYLQFQIKYTILNR